MPLTGDFGRLRELRRAFEVLAKQGGAGQTSIAKAVGAELRPLVREQFQKSVGPDGAPWPARADGKPALVSNKLGNSFSSKVIPLGLAIYSKISWLEAHQDGHTFPPRQGGGQWLRYGRGRGGSFKLVSFRRFLNATRGAALAEGKGDSQSFVKTLKSGKQKFSAFRVRTAAHAIGQRVLKRRRIYPVGTMPARWARAIEKGARSALKLFLQRRGFFV